MLIIPILATNTQIIRALNGGLMPQPQATFTYLVVQPGRDHRIITHEEFIDLRIKVDLEKIQRDLFVT